MRTLVALAALVAAVTAAGAAVIDDFDVQVTLDPDGSFLVSERLTVDFGAEERHGIYRRLPVAYERDMAVGTWRLPGRHEMRFALGAVTDAHGKPQPRRIMREGRYVTVRIGDPEQTVHGVQTYQLDYRVARAINYFADHDEWYWNCTGADWEWPIRNAACTLVLPVPVEPSRVRVRSYTGPFGATGTTATTSVRERTVTARAGPLGVGEGLTVAVALPKGTVETPSRLTHAKWWAVDNAPWLAMLVMPLVALGSMVGVHRRWGRDPGAGEPLAVAYAPPDLTPAEVGTLIDEHADTSDVVATVLDLAVRGYLTIRAVDTTRLLFFSHRDYELTRRREAGPELRPHERLFLDALFAGGPTVMLSSLRNHFYQHLETIRASLYRQLVDRELFPASPRTVRRICLLGAVVVPIGVGVLLVTLPRLRGYDPLSALVPTLLAAVLASPVLTAGILALFGRAMPRKTRAGAQASRQALGFREFVERVERDRLERMTREDPTVFERLLPFAVVLGVADAWAEKFRDLVTGAPAWFDAPNGRVDFRADRFVDDLGAGLQTMAATLTSTPRGTAGGGGSSFSGGGGFSGGGFGGGGGGGW